jgi:O-antigen/teichoic acid export membrane protein
MRFPRRILPDSLMIVFLLLLPVVMFHQQTLGDRTLLPTENLYQYLPHSAYREVVNAPEIPHNHLLSDMVLQNYQWKSFIREQLSQGEIPLWNPHQFSGVPFLAAGQQSALYPLSIIYYALPLTSAYGWFIVVNLWLAGVFMALFMRGLGINRGGATLSGVVYQLAGFMIASAVFPMMIAAAVWLPLILLMIENINRGRGFWIFKGTAIPWVIIGAVAIGCNILAGHVEITIYTLLIAGYYAGMRLLWQIISTWRDTKKLPMRWGILTAMWLLVMVGLGLGLGAIQFIPLFEFVQTNWRAERSSLDTVLSYAHPFRDALQFLMPNFYGNPAHHSYLDIFTGQTISNLSNANGDSINFIDWGIKNYVEGALYVGILPLILSGYAIVMGWVRGKHVSPLQKYVVIFSVLLVLALTFMFGLPTYGAIYLLPGINQLNSPFRWIFAVTLAISVLSGIGLHLLSQSENRSKFGIYLGYMLILFGICVLGGLGFSYIAFDNFEPLFGRIMENMAKANEAFADGRAFYNYQFFNVLILGVMLLSSGIIFWVASRSKSTRWILLAIGVTAVDMLIASWGFNPASDPLLLDFTPPAIEFLQGQAGDFRYTTLQDPDQPNILNANMGMSYGLDDVRGYDSIIPKQYVETMRALHPQYQLDFNRVSPIFTPDDWNHQGGYAQVLNEDLFDLLNVKYVITHPDMIIPFKEWQAVYADDAVVIWENDSVMPRAFLVDNADWDEKWLPDANGAFVYRDFQTPSQLLDIPNYEPATITRDSGREKFIDISLDDASWLVVSETYMDGWRAFVRPFGAGEEAEYAEAVQLVMANFQGVEVPKGNWTIRLVYSPPSFQAGLFGSVISVAFIVFLLGSWFWRAYVGINTEDSSGVAKVARNSLAPIILNLFNRGIDFVFAIVMYRMLIPLDIGIYNFAVVVFVWFDIFTNFGLDLFLIREASQAKDRAGYYFYNTSLFRVILSFVGVPLLAGFLFLWQGSGVEAITSDGLIAIGLLYMGLFPASLSKGMTSLFYANEQAEKPAAIATITTMNKAVFGVIVLMLGYGIVGLAAVSILNNILTFAVLVWTGRKFIGQITQKLPDRTLIRKMVTESFPLMLNHFLATIFFQIDIVILQAIKGAVIVAQYSTAYKWLLAINIVPAFFTQALFPVMSRQANEDVPALTRTFTFGIKLLFAMSLPIAVAFTVLAEPLTLILGGAQYVPNGVIALQLMIWSIPIGWMNSLTQYTLIAVGLQRMITRAFIIAVTFNIVVNIIFIPQFNFQAAALATIASEIVLFVPFIYLLKGRLGEFSMIGLLWRPVTAVMAMVLILVLWDAHPLPSLIAGTIVYVVGLVFLRPLDHTELDQLLKILPDKLKHSSVVLAILGDKRKAMVKPYEKWEHPTDEG